MLIPCLWGLALAAGAGGFRPWDLWLALSCGAGAFLMRGAGCTWNDITDRDIDAQVARTRSRPLPSGQVTVRGALIWMVAQALVAALILLTYNALAVGAGRRLAGAGRDLSLCQAVHLVAAGLSGPGLQLGRAAGLGGACGRGSTPAALLLYAAGIAWTLYYDTIYAHQDREDDALIGVKSTARLFGANTRPWLWGFFAATLVLMALPVIAGPARQTSVIAGAGGACRGLGLGLAYDAADAPAEPGRPGLAAAPPSLPTGMRAFPALFLAAAAVA